MPRFNRPLSLISGLWLVGVTGMGLAPSASAQTQPASEPTNVETAGPVAPLEHVVIVMPDGSRIERLMPRAPGTVAPLVPLAETQPLTPVAEPPAPAPNTRRAASAPTVRGPRAALPKSGVTVRQSTGSTPTPSNKRGAVAGSRPVTPTLSMGDTTPAPDVEAAVPGVVAVEAAGEGGGSGSGGGVVAMVSGEGRVSSWRPYVDGGGSSGSLPTVPDSISVQALGTGGQVLLSWSDLQTDTTGSQVERETLNGSDWGDTVPYAVGPTVHSFRNTPGTGTFRYRVATVNALGISGYTGWASQSVTSTPPSAPTGLQVTDAGNRRALLSWTDTTDGAASFQIERTPAFSGGTVGVAAGVEGYLDLSGAGSFSYRIRATNGAGTSAFTGWVAVNVSETIVPAAPSGPSLVDLGANQCRFFWLDNSDNETSFKIERQVQQTGGAWGGTVTITRGTNTTYITDGPSPGTYRYRAAAVNSVGSSAWTAYVTGTVGGGGWTVFNPSADTRLVYVSSSAGNDANTGLTLGAPKKTLAAAYALLRSGYPDWMQLKAGEVWNERMPTWTKSGRSATQRMLVTSYGTGARPKIQTGSATGMDTATVPINYIAFVGVNFIANTWTGASAGGPTGMYFVCTGGNWVIEDCLFERYANNLIIQGWPRLDNIKLRRNVFWNPMRTDVGNTNIYIDNTDNLVVEENMFVNLKSNDSLTASGGTLMSHNAYLHESNGPLTVIGNIAYNARTNLTCRPGGVVRDNLAIRGGQGFQVGWDTYRASTVVGNVCTESRNHHNGQPLGQGLVFAMNSGSVVSHNVIANSSDGLDHYGMWFDADNKAVEVKNNVTYNWWQPVWEAPLYFFNGTAIGPINIHNNDMQQTNSKLCTQFLTSKGSWASFANNKYYTSRPGYCGDSSTEWTFLQWKSIGEPTAVSQQVNYPAPTRTVGSYNATLGGAATTEAFLIEAKKNSKSNWRPQYTAGAVNNYIRGGFGVVLPPN